METLTFVGVSFFVIFIYMRYILIILTTLLLTSCGSYRIQQRGPEITHVLALTKEGDTLKVPIQDLQRDLTPDYYSGYRFHWNNSWWMYNDWYWNYCVAGRVVACYWVVYFYMGQ